MAREPQGFLEHYWRGLGLSARNNSLAYGFSASVTGAFGILSKLAGSPSVVDVFLFAAGACLPFALLNPIVTEISAPRRAGTADGARARDVVLDRLRLRRRRRRGAGRLAVERLERLAPSAPSPGAPCTC